MAKDFISPKGSNIIIKPAASLRGEFEIPGDKSISHRAVMLGALAKGVTEIHHFLPGADCLSTLQIFKQLGVAVEQTEQTVSVRGVGLHGLKSPAEELYAGNSGTTVRLLSGILAGQSFTSIIDGDGSIRKRPMKRVIEPLSQMGASIQSLPENGCAPLLIEGRPLHGVHYATPVASAQVKSAVLLAGLYADGEVLVTEPSLSRDHTERMLSCFGCQVTTQNTTAQLGSERTLTAQRIDVCGDISSAAYFMAAAALLPNSEVLLKNVGVNPTRAGLLTVMKEMGASIELLNQRIVNGEPVADLFVSSSSLRGTIVEGAIIPSLIDELPIIAIMGAFAKGDTIIRDAAELKVKESNRIASITQNLALMGAKVEESADGMTIHGGAPLKGASIKTYGDHRIAMSFAIAALMAEGETTLMEGSCVDISYPEFYTALSRHLS